VQTKRMAYMAMGVKKATRIAAGRWDHGGN